MTGSDSLVARFDCRRPAGALLTALLAVLLFGVLAGSAWAQAVPLSGSADPLPGSNFEGGDGNQVVDNPLRDDWADAVGVRHFPDPVPDEVFTEGSKEDEPGLWVINPDGSPSPPKNNILDAYALVEETAADTFLHLAFTRESAQGTTFMAFELNQRADLWNNGLTETDIACRTTGDIIVTLQVQGNEPSVILQEWTTTATDAATGCATEGTLSDFTDFDDNVTAQGAVNDAAIANLLPASFAWPGGMIGENLFVEASLNLTALLAELNDSPCFSFGSIWMHTRASLSDDSNLDDLIAPEPLFIGNCTAEGVKYHDLNANGNQDAGEPGLGGFRIWADYDNDGVLDANEPFDDTDPVTGAYSIANIQPPPPDLTYSLREMLTPPATGTGGWICSEPTTTINNGPFPCAYVDINSADSPNVDDKDFGNYKNATVIVEKQTVPDGSGTSFGFSSTIPGKANFNLTDGQQNSTTLIPGVYTATETVPAGWTLTDITCSGDTIAPNSSDTGNTATFNAQSGETIKCVFTNTQHASLTVIKETDPASDPQDFDFDLTGTGLPTDLDLDTDAGDATLPSSQVFSLNAAQLGAKTVIESIVPGWTLTDLECTGAGADSSTNTGTRTATLDIDAGENVVCTFTNTKNASVTIVKNAVPDDAQDFAFVTTGSGWGGFSLDDDGDPALPSSRSFTFAAANLGAKTVTESGVAGWTLTDITCTGDDNASDAGSTATLDVDAGEAIVCTFTNARDVGRLEVVKEVVSDDPKESGLFNLQIDGVTEAANVGDGGTTGEKMLPTGDHSVGETAGTATSLAHYESSIECRDEDGEVDVVASDDGTGPLDVEVTKDSDIVCVITNEAILNPAIAVDKKIRNVTLGGAFVDTPPDIDAYVGDTLAYQFAVTNPGNVALAVTISDPRCDAGTLTGPVKTGGDQDGLLDPGETWTYTCTHVVTAADPDPLPNTVTATGTVPNRPPVMDTDSARADIFHPAIDIEKTGPATA